MDINALLHHLSSAQAGSRELDFAVASAIGWTRHKENITDANGQPRARVQWMMPGASNVTGKVPEYTTSLEAAYQLAEFVMPGHSGGCCWEPGVGGAKIEGWPSVESPKAELALCIAALRAKADIDRMAPGK